MVKNKLLSGRVKVTPSANVTADRYQFLGLEQAEPSLGQSTDGFVLTYDSNSPGERLWAPGGVESNLAYSHANSAFAIGNTANVLAQAAFDAANNATDTWVRNAANASSSYANSAYVHANAAFEAANNTNSSAQYANSAYVQANAAFEAANNATDSWVRQAANSASSYANGAFAAANTADQKATSAGSYANSAYAEANNKLDLTGGTITGDLSVAGNLTVSGNTIHIDVTTLNVSDPIIYLAANNYDSDVVGIGFAGNYNDGTTNRHAGLIRMEGSNTFYLFTNYDEEFDTNTLDLTNASLYQAELRANVTANTITVRNVEVLTQANAAFGAANTADQKAVTSGFYANSAYIHANAAFDAANGAFSSANNAVDTFARNTANSASSYANGAFAAANVADQKAVTSGSYANSAYVHANAAFNAANNAVDTWVRDAANSASSYANGAFAAANVADQKSVTSGSYANSAYGIANSSSSYANGAFVAANTADEKAVTSGTYANGAFNSANSASSYANGAFAAANTADQRAVTSGTYANSAYVHANAAFNAANSGTIINTTDVLYTSTFEADGTQSTYNLPSTPISNNQVLVYIDGIYQEESSYTISGSSIEFSSNVATNSIVQLSVFRNSIISTDKFVGNGTALYNLSFTPPSEHNIFVYIDGVYQNQDTYSVSGTVLSLSESVTSSSNIEVEYVSANTSLIHSIDNYTADGVEDTFNISRGSTVTANQTFVYVDGVYQNQDVYSIINNQIIFSEAPPDQTEIEIRTFKNGEWAELNSINAFNKANSAYVHANAAFNAANNATDTWVRNAANAASSYANSAFASANSANSLAQAAFDAANTATGTVGNLAYEHANAAYNAANTADQKAVTSGSYANGAFATANTSDQKAVTSGDYANSAYVQANTADQKAITSGDYANSAYLTANTADQKAVTSGSYANSAYLAANTADQRAVTSGSYANSAYIHANAAFDYANTYPSYVANAIANLVASAPSTLDTLNELAVALNNDPSFATTTVTLIGQTRDQANAAFNAANTADQRAVTSGDYANSAYSVANTADQRAVTSGDYANSAYSAANTADQKAVTSGGYANSSYIHANAAYVAANTADQRAVTSGDYANSAFATANASTSLSQAAFNLANTLGDTTGIISNDTFTANGSQSVFTSSYTPTSNDHVTIYIDGVYQIQDGYEIDGSNIDFSENVPANSIVDILIFKNTTISVDRFDGDNGSTYTLNVSPTTEEQMFVYIDGIYQHQNTYSVSGTTLTFSESVANTSNVEVETIFANTSFISSIDNFNGNGSQTSFNTQNSFNLSKEQIFVYINGVYQSQESYSVSGKTLIFDTAPPNGTVIEIRALRNATEVENIAVNAEIKSQAAFDAANAASVTVSSYSFRTYTGDSACTEFTITSGHSANSILVFENGICQEPLADYTVSGSTLTFTSAPASNVKIQIRELPI